MDSDANARALLATLLDDPARHYSIAELERFMGWDRIGVVDVAAGLERDGLAHRQGDFVFASRAAVRAAQLV